MSATAFEKLRAIRLSRQRTFPRLRFGRLAGAAVVCAVVAASSFARAEDVPISAAARTHFAAGVALLQDPKEPRFEEAYREFKEAYRASPSYKILGNLALCAMKLERDEEAIWAYEEYSKAGGSELDPSEITQIERDLLTLRAGMVKVSIATDPPGATIVDVRTPSQGEPIRNAYGTLLQVKQLRIRRGVHTITAHLEGYVDAQWSFEASGDELPTHVIKLEKIAPPPAPPVHVALERPIPTSAYVAGGVTAVAGIATIILGIAAAKQGSDYETLNDGTRRDEAASSRSHVQTLNTATDIALATTLLAGGATAYFVLTRPTVERPLGLRVSPMWATGGPAAALYGTF